MTYPIWDGITKSTVALPKEALALRHELADAAKRYDWSAVAELLDTHPGLVNSTRPGGEALFTPLHQAADGDAPVEVIRDLVARGAWRTIENARGERPVDVAVRCFNTAALADLEPRLVRHVPYGVLAKIQQRFHVVIRSRVAELTDRHQLRLPELAPLLESDSGRIYFPVPGMSGGFLYGLERDGVNARLTVESWSDAPGGSRQRHEITSGKAILMVDESV